MNTYLCGAFWLLLFPALLSGQAGTPAARDGVDDVEKKLQDLRKQIEELRQQEQALLKVRDQLQKEAAEKRAHYAKVEIKGRLHKETSSGQFSSGVVWQVSSDELTWLLDLGKKKEILASAEQQVGKSVVVTGKVVGRKQASFFGLVPTVVVDSLKAAEE